MYLGLTLTTASTYQMLRGSVIIFTGALSATYLRRKQWGFQWTAAMFLVFMGVLVVGSASSMIGGAAIGQQQQAQHDVRQQASASTSKAGSRAMLGNALVVFSQLFTALQMCLEERFVTGYNAPALVAVGWEGVWGLSGVLLLLVALQTWTDDEGSQLRTPCGRCGRLWRSRRSSSSWAQMPCHRILQLFRHVDHQELIGCLSHGARLIADHRGVALRHCARWWGLPSLAARWVRSHVRRRIGLQRGDPYAPLHLPDRSGARRGEGGEGQPTLPYAGVARRGYRGGSRRNLPRCHYPSTTTALLPQMHECKRAAHRNSS